jgi:hypothetical protein
MGGKNLQPGIAKSGQGENVESDPVYIRRSERIPVEIRDIIRVRLCDVEAVVNSFEEWAKQWD